ncbi:MAG: hypothetical protein WC891_00210 [Actinomycetota bacterium]
MKKMMFRILAVALIVAFTLPAAACGVIDKATSALTGGQKQVTRPAKDKQAARVKPRPQARKQAGKQGLKGKAGNQVQRVKQRIVRLEKVKAAIEKDGKTAEPIYKKVCDRLERLKAKPGKQPAQGKK